MSLNCGMVGLPSCGKTVIFNAITAAGALSYNGSEMNQAVVNVPDQRLEKLAAIYHPQKVVAATLDIVDIPGLNGQSQENGHNSKLLNHIKNVDALLHVVRCFEDGSIPFVFETIDPIRDIETVDLELLAADCTTLENKTNRLTKRVRAGDKDAIRETGHCKKIYDAIQQGIPARRQNLNAQELASIRECNLVSLKPVLYIANVKTMEDSTNKYVATVKQLADSENTEMIIVCGKDEAEISQLELKDQREFLRNLGLEQSSIERLLHGAYRMLGVVNFFTVGEDEVRAWTCRKGDKAPVAAGKIHTDMERGFIRMEVMQYEDLVELGSEAAVAKAARQRTEGRDYEEKDGDVVTVLFNVSKR
jgi:GTP-binding protein YchF